MTPLWTRIPLLAAVASACLLPHEIDGRQHPETARVRREVTNTLPVGVGDRWDSGAFPRGLGTQHENTTVTSVMNPGELKSAVDALAREFGIDQFETPEETHEGATMFGAKVGGAAGCDASYRALLTAGIHARERGGPDNLIYFISDLLWAKREGTGLAYGGRRFTNEEVETALGVGIVFLPLMNPDGVAHDQAENDCWRKNKNPAGTVDLNRNFDYLWDFKTKFAPGLGDGIGSENPEYETYHGTAPFSEPETRNLKWVADSHEALSWALDIHSFAGLILYSWGDDYNQATDPDMNFMNEAYDGKRGLAVDGDDTQYRAYMDLGVWRDDTFVAMRTADAMNSAVKGKHIGTTQAVGLYPASGGMSDYMSSRSAADPARGHVHGFTMEFGYPTEDEWCPFYMRGPEFNYNIRQTGAGLMEFLLAAVDTGLADVECGDGGGGGGEPEECDDKVVAARAAAVDGARDGASAGERVMRRRVGRSG